MTVHNSERSLGFVVIGRNEGARLKAALRALGRNCPDCPVVYVDSGSTDNSVAFARSLGLLVVELDMSRPFTAARARNAGFTRLLESHPELEFVQFLDGDCTIHPGWPDAAVDALRSNEKIAVVSGRRMEQHPGSSIFNKLIDIEWNTPIGEAKAVLGDMCVRVDVFRDVGGFKEDIIAAEDDDICLRIRRAGFRVHRIDEKMSEHDANITRIAQWYKRAMRCGYGYANIHELHGHGPDKYFRRELTRVLVWGGITPVAFLVALLFYPALAALIAAGYFMLIARLAWRRYRCGDSPRLALVYATLIYTCKIPELVGALRYWKNRLFARNHTLIEYK
jgi:GT2 family glycosyltransferase